MSGVPQGSILGPLLFLVYVNDITHSSDKLFFTIFADDTSIIYKDSNLDKAQHIVNKELSHVSDWFKANKLSLNVKIWYFMVFQPTQRKCNNVHLFIDNCEISRADNIKFLGIHIDPFLKWDVHIHNIRSKLSKTIGILFKIKDFVPSFVLKNLYNSLVLSHLSYCNIVWGNTHTKYLNDLFFLQKKMIRLISNSGYRDHTRALFHSCNLLNIFDIYRHQLGIFMYKFINNLLPSTFTNYFSLNSEIHSHNTRASFNFHKPSINTESFKRSVISTGEQLWNNTCPKIKQAKSLSTFVHLFKANLLSKRYFLSKGAWEVRAEHTLFFFFFIQFL